MIVVIRKLCFGPHSVKNAVKRYEIAHSIAGGSSAKADIDAGTPASQQYVDC